MSQQLGRYLRKKALISSLPPHLLVQLRVAAWETPGWSDTGKAGLHTHDRSAGQILSWEHVFICLAGFAYFASLLCTSPWKGTTSA